RIDDICCTDPTATGLYALSLHDALPICRGGPAGAGGRDRGQPAARRVGAPAGPRWVVAHPAALVSGGGGAGGAPGGRARLAAAPAGTGPVGSGIGARSRRGPGHGGRGGAAAGGGRAGPGRTGPPRGGSAERAGPLSPRTP